MKNKNTLLVILISFVTVCCNNNSSKKTTKPKKTTIEVEYKSQKESPENLIDSAFKIWKTNEIKAGRMQVKCATYASEAFHSFIEVAHDNDNRWAYAKTLKKLYMDFNEDGVKDALLVYEREDCEYGNGYVGDSQVPIIFISKNDYYEKEENIVSNMKKAINTKALNIRSPTVAYVEVDSIKNKNIIGFYYDWKEEDPSGQPSIKRSFIFNYKTNIIIVN